MKKLLAPGLAVFIILILGILVSGYFDLWERWGNFDTLMHFSGSVVLAWFLATLFSATVRKLAFWETALFLTGSVLLFGVFWELLEYLSGAYLKGTLIYSYYHGGDLSDTILDLVADISGAFAYMLIIRTGKRS